MEFALRFPGMPGVWGGTSDRERRDLHRERRTAARPARSRPRRKARALPEVRAIYDAMHASTRHGVGDERCHTLLAAALGEAGVELGAYDRRILAWLVGWEPQTVAVVAGWITRPPGWSRHDRLRTVLDALDVAADTKRDMAANCPDCEAHPAALCGTCEWRLGQAEAYDAVAATLRSDHGQ